MYRTIGRRDGKLHSILVTGMTTDKTGRQIFIPSRIARHMAAHYVGEDFCLWKHSTEEEKKDMVNSFYRRHRNIGIRKRRNPVSNPGDAFRALRDVYRSWSNGQLGAAYKEVKRRSKDESMKTCCSREPISDSMGQYFLHLE